MTCIAPCERIQVVDASSILELAAEWETLLESSYDNRLFYTPDWLQVWCRRHGTSGTHLLIHRDDDGRLQALLPLRTQRREDGRVLTLLGDPEVTDYLDGIAHKTQAQRLLTSLWRCALSDLGWDRIELRHVPSNSPLLRALEVAADELNVSVQVEPDSVCPVALLCKDWEGYLQTLGKKQRHEIRRKLRRAQEGVSWSWRTVTTQTELERDLPTFFRLHEASAHTKAHFLTPEMRDFFYDLSSIFLSRGYLRLSVFQRDGVDVSATLGFLYRSRYLLYNSGYDPTFAVYNPGIASVAFAMQDAIAANAVAFDFLTGDEPYKYQFGATNTFTSTVTGIRR